MPDPSYPFGYAGKRKTVAELERYGPWRLVHPEVRRRHLAMYAAAAAEGVDLGVGGAGRTSAQQAAGYAKDPTRFAKPGNSYHETSYVDENGKPWAVAIDNTPSAGFSWLTKNCARFGLVNFPDSKPVKEPWHTQPAELPRSRRNYKPGIHKLKVWDLPTPPAAPSEPTTPPPPPGPDRPPHDTTTEAIVNQLPTLRKGDTGADVRRLQGLLVAAQLWVKIDGQFGNDTDARLRDFQASNGLEVDGVCGRVQTWPALLGV